MLTFTKTMYRGGICMRIEQLVYIREVAKYNSITLAAKNLNVSQPSMSFAITSLEDELKIKIFKRSKSGTIPTQPGQSVLDKAKYILDQIEQLKEIATKQNKLLHGNLNIVTVPTISFSILPKTLYFFKKKYPGIDITVTELEVEQAKEQMLQKKFDIGFFGGFKKNLTSASDKTFEINHLIRGKMMACVGKEFPLANEKIVSMNEILKHPLIVTTKVLRDMLKEYGTPQYFFNTNHLDGAKNIIAEGMCIGFYINVSLMSDPYVSSGNIIPIEIAEDMDFDLYLMYERDNYSPIIEVFLKELHQQIDIFKRMYNF